MLRIISGQMHFQAMEGELVFRHHHSGIKGKVDNLLEGLQYKREWLVKVWTILVFKGETTLSLPSLWQITWPCFKQSDKIKRQWMCRLKWDMRRTSLAIFSIWFLRCNNNTLRISNRMKLWNICTFCPRTTFQSSNWSLKVLTKGLIKLRVTRVFSQSHYLRSFRTSWTTSSKRFKRILGHLGSKMNTLRIN